MEKKTYSWSVYINKERISEIHFRFHSKTLRWHKNKTGLGGVKILLLYLSTQKLKLLGKKFTVTSQKKILKNY